MLIKEREGQEELGLDLDIDYIAIVIIEQICLITIYQKFKEQICVMLFYF